MAKEQELEKAKRTDMFLVPVGQIEVEEGFNVREDFGDIEALAKSIKENGLRVPLKGFKKHGTEIYVLTDGHRRFKAVQLAIKKGAEILNLPMITEKQSEDKRTLDLVLSNDGKPLTMLEEAAVYERMVAYGWTIKQLATATGKSQTAIDNCLILLTASPDTKQKIKDNLVSATVVVEKLRKKSGKDVEKEVSEAIVKTGGKKVTAKHLKEEKPISISSKDLERLHTALSDGYDGLDEDKMSILLTLSEFGKGNVSMDELANALV